MIFESPMLAPSKSAHKVPGLDKLIYPLMASPKLDGIRATVHNGKLLSRTLKEIPNAYAQTLFNQLPEGMDGELILGEPTHKDVYRDTVSAVMSQDGQPEDLRMWLFDNFTYQGGFETRFKLLSVRGWNRVGIVPHVIIESVSDLEKYEEDALQQGFEGVMLRSLTGEYKQGRATSKQAIILKLKRFVDAEAVILGTYEEMHNGNESFENELGRTARSSHQENLVGKDTLGGFEVEDTKTGVQFKIGTGLDKALKEKLWSRRKKLIGQIVKYKYFPTGSKDKPRHPVFLGFRSKDDM